MPELQEQTDPLERYFSLGTFCPSAVSFPVASAVAEPNSSATANHKIRFI